MTDGPVTSESIAASLDAGRRDALQRHANKLAGVVKSEMTPDLVRRLLYANKGYVAKRSLDYCMPDGYDEATLIAAATTLLHEHMDTVVARDDYTWRLYTYYSTCVHMEIRPRPIRKAPAPESATTSCPEDTETDDRGSINLCCCGSLSNWLTLYGSTYVRV